MMPLTPDEDDFLALVRRLNQDQKALVRRIIAAVKAGFDLAALVESLAGCDPETATRLIRQTLDEAGY